MRTKLQGIQICGSAGVLYDYEQVRSVVSKIDFYCRSISLDPDIVWHLISDMVDFFAKSESALWLYNNISCIVFEHILCMYWFIGAIQIAKQGIKMLQGKNES